jgi:hypothetical protein
MSGIARFNFPAFDAARDRLTELGWRVISPADLDRAMGINEDTRPEDVTLADKVQFARQDLEAVQECEAIFMLSGWEHSGGARAEHAVACWLRKRIFYEAALPAVDPAPGVPGEYVRLPDDMEHPK